MTGIHHFLFLSDPRTLRIIGEPKASNAAVIRLSEATGMNVNTVSTAPDAVCVIAICLAEC